MSLNINQTPPARNPFPPGKMLRLSEAAEYLGVSPRWLEGNPEIPRVNLATAGRRPMWRYRLRDLDEHTASRRQRNAGGGS